MPTLRIRFTNGRYHATPWGHHVNEGLIEWPPSPWRLLRALIGCGFSSQGWLEIPPTACNLIVKLSSVLPSFSLPEATTGHCRHYMPVIEGKSQKTTLVFDTWANVADGELMIHWPCELTGEELMLLGQLASSLGYLGRSESWVDVDLATDLDFHARECNAFPHREGLLPERSFEQVSLLAAIPSVEYQRWYNQQVEVVLAGLGESEEKRRPAKALLAEREEVVSPYPPDLMACLTKDTAWWKGYGWSQPPGSQRVLYWRRSDTLQVSAPQRSKPRKYDTVTTVLLSLTSPSGNRGALPSITRTLPQAELLHRAIVGRLGEGQRVSCPELTGRDEMSRPLRHHHVHAHTLPLDLDGDGGLDHILIYAPMGLGDTAQRAIRKLRRTWTKGGVGELQLAVAGSGDLEMLRQLPFDSVERLLGSASGSLVWESTTPFVFPRFIKPRGRNTMLGQINAELESRGLQSAVSVDVLPELTRALRHFVRRRGRGRDIPPVDAGYGLRLVFAEPLRGPLMLGYAAHYGLGLFHASE